MLTIDTLTQALEPHFYIEAKKRKKRSGSNYSRRKIWAVGAIVILTDSNGAPYRCQLTHQDAKGEWFCIPLD